MPSISSLISKYFSHEEVKPPPITAGSAVTLLLAYTIAYVLPFYLSSATRPSITLSRDSPSVIRARVTAVSMSCVVCSTITVLVLVFKGGLSNQDAVHLLGYWPIGLAETAKSLLLTAILFIGPLFEILLAQEACRDWVHLEPISELFQEWTSWRNYVVGPLTEEILFRSASVPLMLLAKISVTKTIFLSPVIFGLAHAHHFYEFRLTNPHVPLVSAALRTVFQFSFTTLFGAYATFLFLRTGSLAAIFIVHAFCNSMGLPRVAGRVHGADGSRRPLAWSVTYYVLLVAGAIGWWRCLGPLTRSTNTLATMEM